jgi:drug/metabolite transporter (DMT)-like permease
MIEIIITISTFSSMVMLFKYFEKINVNNLQAISANYFTAGILSIIFLPNTFEFDKINYSNTTLFFVLAFIVGLLFVLTFNLYAHGAQKIGVTPSTIANKMSMIIPIIIGLILLNEEVTFNKILGISFAFVAIFLSSTGDRKYSLNKNHLIIIVLLFIGQGLADGILNWAQKFILNGSNMNLFFAVTFLAAGFTGLLFIFFKLSSQKVKIEPKSIIWGIVLGIPNYLTLLYFVKSLKSELFSSSEIFPIINIGVIIFCTILSIILFRERVSIYNWLGVILGVFSIFIILS